MSTSDSGFRNQRTRFRNFSPPYGDKAVFDPATPDEGVAPRGGLPSRKNGRVIGFWDMREHAAIVLLEGTPGVLGYEERPERLKLRDGPSWFFYVPHFSVRLGSGTAIVELSTNGRPENPRQEAVALMARAHYATRGVGFVEIAHSVIRARPRATDAHVILRYLSVVPSATDQLRASDALSAGPASVAAVEARSGVSHGRLLAMVRLGTLELGGGGPVGRTATLVLPCKAPRP